jgi:hypothetical protein
MMRGGKGSIGESCRCDWDRQRPAAPDDQLQGRRRSCTQCLAQRDCRSQRNVQGGRVVGHGYPGSKLAHLSSWALTIVLLAFPGCRTGGTSHSLGPSPTRALTWNGQPLRGCGRTTLETGSGPPWAVSAPTTQPYGIAAGGDAVGYLFRYPLRAGHPTNPVDKILWVVRLPRSGHDLVVTGHPIGASKPEKHLRERPDSEPGETYPSVVDMPAPGCWR